MGGLGIEALMQEGDLKVRCPEEQKAGEMEAQRWSWNTLPQRSERRETQCDHQQAMAGGDKQTGSREINPGAAGKQKPLDAPQWTSCSLSCVITVLQHWPSTGM